MHKLSHPRLRGDRQFPCGAARSRSCFGERRRSREVGEAGV